PHSDIRGSKIALISPRLIAECPVLHRLCMPRHPPNALLKRLIIKSRPPRTGANPKAKATDLTQLQPEWIRSKKHATRGTRPKRDFTNRKIPHFSAPRGFLSTFPNHLPRSNKKPAKLFLRTRRTSIGHTRPRTCLSNLPRNWWSRPGSNR